MPQDFERNNFFPPNQDMEWNRQREFFYKS